MPGSLSLKSVQSRLLGRDIRLPGALEWKAGGAPLVLAAGVVADLRVAQRFQPLCGDDGVVAVRVRAVDDDLRLEVGDAFGETGRIDCGRRHVDRARQVRVR